MKEKKINLRAASVRSSGYLDWDLTLRALVLENYTVLQQYLVSKPIKTDWLKTREEKNVMFDD